MVQVKNLSADQRIAVESILGRTLRDEESLIIRPARMLKDAPATAERAHWFRRYQDQLDTFAERVKDIPENEIDSAIEEAVEYARHHAE
jgi:hypothetical protein